MHIICLQEKLKQALSITERIIGRNLTLPILNNVLLTVENNKLKISSTNLEIGISCWISGKIEQNGSITIPAKLISNFIGNLPKGKIELKTKDNQLEVKSENFKSKIKGLSADDFPIIPQLKEDPIMVLKKNNLKEGLSQVVKMASFSDSRPEISGVYMNFDKNNLKLVATDSFRLAEKNLELSNKINIDPVIIPQRTIQEVIRILGEEDLSDNQKNDVSVILSQGQVLFDFGSVQVVSKLIEGQYPDYQQLIPSDLQTQLILNREDLIKNIKVASLFGGKANGVKLDIKSKDQALEISSKDTDLGENKSNVSAKVEGKDLSIDFNYLYILDGLNHIYSDKIIFGFNSNNSPAIIKPVGDVSYTYVIMPIKV